MGGVLVAKAIFIFTSIPLSCYTSESISWGMNGLFCTSNAENSIHWLAVLISQRSGSKGRLPV